MPSTAKSTVKDEELYEELREEGNSKQESSRIANAAARDGRSAVGKRGRTIQRLRRLERGRLAEQSHPDRH